MVINSGVVCTWHGIHVFYYHRNDLEGEWLQCREFLVCSIRVFCLVCYTGYISVVFTCVIIVEVI